MMTLHERYCHYHKQLSYINFLWLLKPEKPYCIVLIFTIVWCACCVLMHITHCHVILQFLMSHVQTNLKISLLKFSHLDFHHLHSFSCSESWIHVHPRSIKVSLPPLYRWHFSHEQRYQALHACTTSKFVFRSMGAWEWARMT